MGYVRMGWGKAIEEGRIPSLKLSNRVPKAHNRVLQHGIEVGVSRLLSISSFEIVLSFKLRCMLSLVSLYLKMTSNR